ncbi:amidophosphoribosyltransferase [uncultured Dubosiella sp.]|jgi:amidophosphoribosyltransferase|uniref:amidophosphoribosyltransferase n=1 Tax=uncultured Dubosiella sp. TaxID=1937011 RepID=UPI00208B2FE1|nr:amidophosphoribosyltransferase [uncultured Dubosiella sp.]GJM56380.1 amidophosphoribosyltransferase [Erysipelotrichaceae bacterium OPF54]
MFDEIHEECGVFGAYHVKDAASITYYGLHTLQHRGQEASGIASEKDGKIRVSKGKGLTIDVFTKEKLEQLGGNNAIGHVRYSTAGGQENANIQPIVSRGRRGETAIVHNGQIVNEKELRVELEDAGCIFQGTSDSEIVLHMIQMEEGTLLEKVMKTASRLVGAFSILVMSDDEIIAVRDQKGLRPLSYTKMQDGYVIGSETCAFEVLGLYSHTDVLPGQAVQFKDGIVRSFFYEENVSSNMCAMEYIYFARPDSVIENINVHNFRKETGRLLARKDDVQADLVIGVPDSSLSAAIGYAEESGIPFETGLVKNRFVGRTFIQPTQSQRDRGVRMKLSAIEQVVSGKSVVMIDDSIVRGTTSRRIVRLLKDAGAAQVHVRIASPIITSPCFYGVDTSTKEELIGARMNCDEICSYIEADSLKFMEIEELKAAADGNGLCTACFDGKYCTDLFSYAKVLEA